MANSKKNKFLKRKTKFDLSRLQPSKNQLFTSLKN